MAVSGRGVDIAAAFSSSVKADGRVHAGACCSEAECATSSSAASRSVLAGQPTFPHGDYLHDSSPCIYPSSSAPTPSPSACLSQPLTEKRTACACAAERASMPALLIICLSPELLRSPTCLEERRQTAQQKHQLALHPQQAEEHGQQQQSWKQQHTQEARKEELHGQPQEHSSIPGRFTATTGSRVCLPSDSPGYIFLAEQFLPSLGLPIGDGLADIQEDIPDALSNVYEPPFSPARTQQGESPCKAGEDQRQPQDPKHRQEQHEQKRLQCELGTGLPPGHQPLSQPQLNPLPATCLLQTKYYEAPLRLVYQNFEPPVCDSSVHSPTATSSAADVNFSESQHSSSGAPLHLATPPEAVLLLCSNLTDLYRAHELLGNATQQTPLLSSESSGVSRQVETTAAAAAAAAESGQSMPVPYFLRQPPYILLGGDMKQEDSGAIAAKASEQAVRVGKPNKGETPDVRTVTTTGRAEEGHCAFQECTYGESETAEEGEVTSGNWLSTVPVKLLVCFDAEEKKTDSSGEKRGETNATVDSCSFFPPHETYEDNEDPSVILFFENGCFLEKVSLSLPTRSLGGQGADPALFSLLKEKNEAQVAAGTVAAEAPAAASMDTETGKETEGARKQPCWCSVRPLLGTPLPPVLGTATNNGNMRALQRLVEALHCHMWSNMRLLENSSTHGRTGKLTAPTARRRSGKSSAEVHSSTDARISGSTFCSTTSKADATGNRSDAEVAAGTDIINREGYETDVREQKEAIPAAGLPTSGGAAAARKLTTSASESHAPTGEARRLKASARFSDKGLTLAAGDVTREGGGNVCDSKSQESREGMEDRKGRKGREKTTEEIPFQAWESLARTVREMRLEAPQLSRAERTAKAETLTLQLAQALGLSDDEDDE